MPAGISLFFHLLFAFVFVGAVLSAHWNVFAARRTTDWSRRAVLLEANARATMRFGLSSLVLLAVVGNVTAMALDHRVATSAWLWMANGLWLLLLAAGVFDLGAARRLAAFAAATATGGPVPGGAPASYEAALGRWRLSNALLLAGFLAFLALMVFRWRS